MQLFGFAKIPWVIVGFLGSGKPEPSLMEKACAAFLILMQENLHIKMCDNLVVPPVLNLFRNKEESFRALMHSIFLCTELSLILYGKNWTNLPILMWILSTTFGGFLSFFEHTQRLCLGFVNDSHIGEYFLLTKVIISWNTKSMSKDCHYFCSCVCVCHVHVRIRQRSGLPACLTWIEKLVFT